MHKARAEDRLAVTVMQCELDTVTPDRSPTVNGCLFAIDDHDGGDCMRFKSAWGEPVTASSMAPNAGLLLKPAFGAMTNPVSFRVMAVRPQFITTLLRKFQTMKKGVAQSS